uniref:GAG-pre-integrase domain-containing protein n=1 Tax=Tanacetum cinerariifolium TaxID=118510 RepID=A0A6L2KV23_TANCI|nr:hypothetical protein [Tanacetum cinerariifolium]
MVVDAQSTNNTTIRSILLAEKLTGSNFTNCYRNLRIVLRYEKKLKFVEQPTGPAPNPETADLDTIDKYYEIVNLEEEVACLMLSSMSPYLQRTLEKYNAYDMLEELKLCLKSRLNRNCLKQSKCFTLAMVTQRNWPSYHAELKKRKNASGASTSGIFTIELYAFPNKTRVYDTGYGTHICNTLHGLRESKKLKHGSLILNKRAKHALDSSYLWHCRLGHINKKRMKKLQCDGILQPTHDEFLKKCKSCISGKMARKPFPHKVKRAKDLLGLIHTDVCGPFRTVLKEGVSYFINFTNDFNRYGYVYLMKHKHETSLRNLLNTSEIHNEVAPTQIELQNDKVPSCRSARIPQAPDRYGFYVDVEEHELGDFDEPPNYEAALSDPKSKKWLEAMNTKMQSMKDNQFWYFVNLPPDGRTVGTYILGIKIIRDRSKRLIALSQSAYLEKTLKKFRMENSKKGHTPMIENSIMYVVRCTTPDVAFAQNLCSRFQQNPGEIYWTVVKAILKYLRNTKDMVLVYGEKPEAELKVSCYVDASFQTDKDDTKSQTGYLIVHNGGAID